MINTSCAAVTRSSTLSFFEFSMRHLLSLFAILSVPALAEAQSHLLAGQWNISTPLPMRGENGQPTMVIRKGLMTITVAGDSLIANLKMEPQPGEPARRDQRLVGLRRDGIVRLLHVSTAALRGGSEDLQRQASTTYALDAKGDTLTGVIQMQVEGIPDIPEFPLTGTRVTP